MVKQIILCYQQKAPENVLNRVGVTVAGRGHLKACVTMWQILQWFSWFYKEITKINKKYSYNPSEIGEKTSSVARAPLFWSSTTVLNKALLVDMSIQIILLLDKANH